jgi:hypothetical protein
MVKSVSNISCRVVMSVAMIMVVTMGLSSVFLACTKVQLGQYLDVSTTGDDHWSSPAEAVANEPIRVSTFAAVNDSAVLDGCLHAGAHAAQHTATVGPDGHIRKFHVHVCKKEMSMAELYPVFAAHAMEWAIMGRDNAWWSVITNEKYKDNNQDLPVHVKDEFFASGKCVGLSYTLGVM